jgi:hypothetical protein
MIRELQAGESKKILQLPSEKQKEFCSLGVLPKKFSTHNDVTIQTRPPWRQTDARRRGRNRTSSRGVTNGGMVAGRAGRGARVCAGVHAFSVCPESHFHILFGIRQQDRTMNRELQRSAGGQRLGGGMGLVAGQASSLMATRKRNLRPRPRRALGWAAKTGSVAGPTESPVATRTKRSAHGPTSGVMATVLALGGAIV